MKYCISVKKTSLEFEDALGIEGSAALVDLIFD